VLPPQEAHLNIPVQVYELELKFVCEITENQTRFCHLLLPKSVFEKKEGQTMSAWISTGRTNNWPACSGCGLQNPSYLYNPSNETAGRFVPAQILYDVFHGRYHNATGAIVLLCVIWGSFFFGGLSITTSAARVVSSSTNFFKFRSKLTLKILYHFESDFFKNKTLTKFTSTKPHVKITKT